MSNSSTVEELETLRKQFLEWRQNNPQSRFPKHFWNSAVKLTSKYDLKTVAKQTGYPPSYLRRKIEDRSASVQNEVNFIEVKPEVFQQEVRLRIQQQNGMMTELTFQGGVEQVFPLLSPVLQGVDL